MPLLKYKKEELRQGYPPAAATNNVDLLAQDRRLLLEIFNDSEQRTDPDKLLSLEVGSACKALRETVKTKLIDLCLPNGAVYKLMDGYRLVTKQAPPDLDRSGKEVAMGDFTFIMPSLKKIPRITEKAVTYAVCDNVVNSAEPLLERVVDILRGTLILEKREFLLTEMHDNKGNLGSQLIDTINKAFNNNVVQVKNRFMDIRKPILYNYTATDFVDALNNPNNHVVEDERPDAQKPINEVTRENRPANKNLVNNIATMVNSQLKARDTFYRDLQLLIKLPAADFPNNTHMTHVYFELQITTRELYASKSVHASDSQIDSGHEQYVKIRRVMEYCEYMYWAWNKKVAAKNPNFQFNMPQQILNQIFPTPLRADYLDFRDTLEAMWNLYAKYCPIYRGIISKAIDDSTWYKGA